MSASHRFVASLVGILLAVVLGTRGAAAAESAPRMVWDAPRTLATGDAWQGPWRMNASDFRYVDDPTVAVSPDGSFAVAWVDQAGKDVMLQVFDADASARFEAGPSNVSRSPEVFSWLPRVVLGRGDDVHVLWQEIRFTGGSHGGEILFARSTDGGRSFSEPINLSETPAGAGKGRLTADRWHNGSLDLVRADDGTLYAAWTEYEGALRIAHSTDGGGSFSAPIELVPAGDPAPARGPALAVAHDGTVVVAWAVGEDPAADIHLSRSSDGGRTFTEPYRAHVSPGHADAPTMAVDAEGRVHLAYGYRPADAPERGRIAVTHSDDGRRFGPPQLLTHADDVPEGGIAFPALATRGELVHLVAERVSDTGRAFEGLVHAWGSAGDGFSAAHTLPASTGPAAGPSGGRQGLLMRKLAVRPDGEVLAVHSTFEPRQRSAILLYRGRPSALP